MFRHFRTTMAVAAGAALIATGFGTAALAQSEGRRAGPARFLGSGLPLRGLDLTDAQRDQIREVMQRHRQEMQEAGQRLRGARTAQREAVETVPANEGLIQSTSQVLAAAETTAALVRARIYTDVWAVLTPEQQAKAKELKDRRAQRMKQRGERRLWR